VSGPRQAEAVRRALDVQVDGAGVFDVVQATWNLLEPSAGPALAEAKGRGRGVIVKEALANGRLSPHGEGPPLAMLGRLAARHGVGVDAVALAAALANPWADVVLSGAVSAGQLAGNLAAARRSLADEELEELRTLAEPAEAYWAARGRLRWA
jgi:aryl-alcohol dehydrogenase-like predicted oxidoreductase